MKYVPKKKYGAKLGKQNNSNATSGTSPSTLQEGSSGSNLLCFSFKKDYSKGHEKECKAKFNYCREIRH